MMRVRIRAWQALAAVCLAGLLTTGCTALPASPLTRAAADGDVAALNQLLRSGAGVDDADRHGLSALDWAARTGQVESIRALIEAGADVNRVDERNRWTPLLHAVHKRQPEAVRE